MDPCSRWQIGRLRKRAGVICLTCSVETRGKAAPEGRSPRSMRSLRFDDSASRRFGIGRSKSWISRLTSGLRLTPGRRRFRYRFRPRASFDSPRFAGRPKPRLLGVVDYIIIPLEGQARGIPCNRRRHPQTADPPPEARAGFGGASPRNRRPAPNCTRPFSLPEGRCFRRVRRCGAESR